MIGDRRADGTTISAEVPAPLPHDDAERSPGADADPERPRAGAASPVVRPSPATS